MTIEKSGWLGPIVANGGIGHFHLKTTGCQDKVIVLTIDRVAGQSGSAVFADSNMPILNVLGDADMRIRVRAWQVSDLPWNMVVQARNPVTGVLSTVTFTNFWTVPSGQFQGAVPVEATGADGPIRFLLMGARSDRRNALGWGVGNRGEARGFALMRFSIIPNGTPNLFRSGGPGDGFDIQRRIWSRVYQDSCPVQAVDDQSESSSAALKSLIPTAERGVLNIYDLDAPSLSKTLPGMPTPKQFVRNRSNLTEWAIYTDDDGTDRRASNDYDWFFRASWRGTIALGVPGLDNQVGADSTQLTYDLNAPRPAPDFDVAFFTPQSANSSQAMSVEVHILGYFPDAPGDNCQWLAYLLAANSRPSGDPDVSSDAQSVPASSVVKNGDSEIVAIFPLRQGIYPVPAGDYQLNVVRGTTSHAGPVPFKVTENPFDHWLISPVASQAPPPQGPNLTLYVVSVDASNVIVSRPGQPPPSITIVGGTVALQNVSPALGTDGNYYIEAQKVDPRSSGVVNIQASGGGVPTVTGGVVVR